MYRHAQCGISHDLDGGVAKRERGSERLSQRGHSHVVGKVAAGDVKGSVEVTSR